MTPATHWRAEKSTAFPLASTLICVLPPGSGTSPFVLLPCPTPQMDAGQLLIPWNLNSHWDNKSLHKLLLELACERCTHSSVPFWGFFQNQFHHKFGPCKGHSNITTRCKVFKGPFKVTFANDILHWEVHDQPQSYNHLVGK